MEQVLVAAAIFGIPVLLLVVGFRIAGRSVHWKPLFWAGIAFATYMLLLRSRGVLPEPAVMEALELNWFGKSLSLLGTCCLLTFLPRVSFRAAGVRWQQEQHSLRPVIITGVASILGATITANEAVLPKLTPKGTRRLRIEDLQEMPTMVTQRIERITRGWLLEGKKEGEQIGIRKGELAMLRRLLERKFGELTPEAIERLERADVDLLLQWSDRVLTATKLDDIFES